MTKLIINSDDFGYSRGVNYGIVDCFNHGILTSTTLMANMPGFSHAVELAKSNSGLGVGVHMTLTCGRSILQNLKTITTENGMFKKLAHYKEAGFEIDTGELYQEWDAQIQKVYASGIVPTHLDSHHHVHTMGPCIEVALELAKKYQLPIRKNFLDDANIPLEGIKIVDYFVDDFDYTGLQKEFNKTDEEMAAYFEKLLETMSHFESVEIMCHPAYLDRDIMEGSSLNTARVIEADILMNSTFSKKVKESTTLKLSNYSHL
ncbi:carbohydrate deacetylase [Listeria ivanovii]|uniref:Carbohydrate deacetylase n=1 Tax=Listeria ivanovii (strain ATCC BAA-678 / PAM 55) TaxID=881621 RepID=G2Z8V3_LISIP|nr:carbohydrate deacetylase [Listeria ivanovii]AHI54698.1 hypothetical protein AX25_00645 [Listeria ivanovii WSLC3009]AIS64165.1 hypothetical protein JL52_00635 [Listeria ivanovii subsp. ivanovii]MBC1759556.1 carbohydrate deacetylase [Listeria ivanovii]MBK3915677.1 carbohydrate deacetylase [Listeria ivanovii subsp. ivanovii]MBK3922773.1 carbohydrate deacetylase [Listeria ivanovii subsp. ivanovii]